MDLTWAGMSSGPSMSCTQPASAGAIRPSAVTRSVRTSGSAFSWMTSEAEVCRRKSKSTPSRALISSRKRATSRVISKKPSPEVSTVSTAVADRLHAARCEWGTNRRALRRRFSFCSRLAVAPARSPRPADATPGRRGPSCGRGRGRNRLSAAAYGRRRASAGGSGMVPAGNGRPRARISFFSAAFSLRSRAISFSRTARSSGTAWQAQPTARWLHTETSPVCVSSRKNPSATLLKV